MKLKLKNRKRYYVTIKFEKKNGFSKTAYYKVTAEEIKNLFKKNKEKKNNLLHVSKG